MKRNRLTINDIAEALGISKSTVSRALRDQHDISPATRKRIMEYVEEHNYHPDFTARNLRSRSTRTIGVIVPAHNIPFYSIAICGIQDFAMQKGYNVMVCHSSEQYEVEKRNVDALLGANVEGIIISVARDTEKNEHVHKLKKMGVPLVMFNRVVEDLKAAKVVVDDYYGALNMVNYLVESGCRKIAHIAGPANILLSSNRKQGYMDALAAHQIGYDPELVAEGDFTLNSGIESMELLLSSGKPIDAVFCVCDAAAFGAMKSIKNWGLSIPGDISVAGFTNEPLSELVDPPLSTVKQPIYEIGESASRLLFAQLENPDLPPEFCVLNTELEIRDSTR